MRDGHIEIECKLELDESTYEKIKTSFSGVLSEPRLQKNTFFDTEDKKLLKTRWVCRLRFEADRSFLTVKGKGSVEGAVHARPEFESEIPADIASDILSGFRLSSVDSVPTKKLLDTLGDLRLEPYMGFENERIEIPFGSYVLELDKTNINGSIFYELEAETDSIRISDLENSLRRLFMENGWDYCPSQMSKFKRTLLMNGIRVSDT